MSTQLDLLTIAPSSAQPSPAVEQQWPDWFKPSKGAKIHEKRVALGRHPFGRRLSGWPGATCGNCGSLQRVKYRSKTHKKCERSAWTHGPATDVRAGWRGCEVWAPGLYRAAVSVRAFGVLQDALTDSDEGRDALTAMDALREQADKFGSGADIAHAIAMVALYKAEGCKGIVRRLLEVSR